MQGLESEASGWWYEGIADVPRVEPTSSNHHDARPDHPKRQFSNDRLELLGLGTNKPAAPVCQDTFLKSNRGDFPTVEAPHGTAAYVVSIPGVVF